MIWNRPKWITARRSRVIYFYRCMLILSCMCKLTWHVYMFWICSKILWAGLSHLLGRTDPKFQTHTKRKKVQFIMFWICFGVTHFCRLWVGPSLPERSTTASLLCATYQNESRHCMWGSIDKSISSREYWGPEPDRSNERASHLSCFLVCCVVMITRRLACVVKLVVLANI